jgi:hypothetical protein
MIGDSTFLFLVAKENYRNLFLLQIRRAPATEVFSVVGAASFGL